MNADKFTLKQSCKAIFSLYYSKYKEYLIDIEGNLYFNNKNLVIPNMFLILNNNNFKGIFFKFKEENKDLKDKSYFLVDYLIQSGYKYVEISEIWGYYIRKDNEYIKDFMCDIFCNAYTTFVDEVINTVLN